MTLFSSRTLIEQALVERPLSGMPMFDKTHLRDTLVAMERADIAAAQRSYDARFGEAHDGR
jgi:hypothetical protein